MSGKKTVYVIQHTPADPCAPWQVAAGVYENERHAQLAVDMRNADPLCRLAWYDIVQLNSDTIVYLDEKGRVCPADEAT